jgi:hypothetical protein
MLFCKLKGKVTRINLAWLLSFLLIFLLVVPAAALADNDESGPTITISLRATGLEGDIFRVDSYELMAGEITIDGFSLDRQTAMGAVAAYALENDINFEIMDWGWGLSADQIGDNDHDRGNWSYYINETSPMAAADQFVLADGDALHFVNYNLDLYTLTLGVDKDEIELGDIVTVTVQYTNGDGVSAPVEGASIYLGKRLDEYGSPAAADDPVGLTDGNGEFPFTPDRVGIFYPYAEWDGKSSLYQWPTVSLAVGEETVTPDPDPHMGDWVKNGKTVLDALLKFQQADGSFWWLEDTEGVGDGTTAQVLAAMVDLAYGGSAKHRAGQSLNYNLEYRLLSQAIEKAVQWYQKDYPAPDSWEGLAALRAAGENLNERPWQDTQGWRDADPGLAPDAEGSEHIHYIFRLLAVGLDPANAWENRNLFAELAAQQQEDGSFGKLGKHIWAIVALDVGRNLGEVVGDWSADENNAASGNRRQDAVNFLLRQQNGDGSFGEFSQLDYTGWALVALSNYQGDENVDQAIGEAVTYLHGRQKDNAGFQPPTGEWGPEPENANSNASVISGLVAVGVDLAIERSITPIDDTNTGGNGSSPGGEVGPTPSSITVGVEIVGKNAVYFTGNVALPSDRANALEALRETGVSFSTRENENYVYEIAGEGEALSSSAGWKYKVNGVLPSVPAKSCNIKDGDEVLWFWATDAGAQEPGSGENSEAAETILTLPEMGDLEKISATARRRLVDFLEKGPTTYPLEESPGQTIVIGGDQPLGRDEKEELENKLQDNVVGILQYVAPGEGMVISDAVGEIILQIAEGSLADDIPGAEFSVEEISDADLPAAPGFALLSPAYNLGPEGAKFLEPLLFSIRLAIPDEIQPEDVLLAWLDRKNGHWYALPTVVDLSSGYVSAFLEHFSSCAVLARQNTAGPVAFTPLFSDVTPESLPWACEAIEYLARRGIIEGVGKDCFVPSRDLTRGEFTAMLAGVLELDAGEKVRPIFTDVEEDLWCFAAISATVQAGIVRGITETTFEPQKGITREQMAVMLARAYSSAANKVEAGETSLLFSDAGTIAHWARDDVQKIVSRGLIKGFPDGTFRPKGLVTRAQAAVVLYHLLNEL